MSFKKFDSDDIVYTTIVANPQYNFLVQNGKVYRNNEIAIDGDFSNKINHVDQGQLSFHELNVNRPADNLIYGFISQDTTRYSYSTISTSQFNLGGQFAAGNVIKQDYPLKAGLSRIFVEDGPEFDNHDFNAFEPPQFAGSNKKYIRALTNVMNTRDHAGAPIEYADYGTKNVNMICVPGIFYGSTIEKGSVELNYYITGSNIGQLKDVNKDGRLIQTAGSEAGSVAGIVIYEQGLMLLTGSWLIDSELGQPNNSKYGHVNGPRWVTFGAGIPLVGNESETGGFNLGDFQDTTFEIKFRGTNRIPTLTMMAYAEKGELNYSNNPTFLEKEATPQPAIASSSSYSQPKRTIKNITKSRFDHHSASFQSTTFLSKIGIYDENKNLIAIATLAKPLKKTPDRDYMIKMRMDF